MKIKLSKGFDIPMIWFALFFTLDRNNAHITLCLYRYLFFKISSSRGVHYSLDLGLFNRTIEILFWEKQKPPRKEPEPLLAFKNIATTLTYHTENAKNNDFEFDKIDDSTYTLKKKVQ